MSHSASTFSQPATTLRLRGLGSLVLSLLLVVGMFRFWPTSDEQSEASNRIAEVRPQEIIELELIEPTVQDFTVPPSLPPPPQDVLLPPVEVPDNRVIEERVRELELSVPSANAVPNAPPAPPPGPAGPPRPASTPPRPVLVRNPDRSPVPVRFSEPAYPQAARDDGIRARVRIEVLVDERGQVRDTRITERVRLGRGDSEERVSSLPYGIEQSALAAARRYQFRPARHDGRAVQSYTTITCNFGL